MKTIHDWKEERMRIWNVQQDLLKRAQADGRALNDDENRQFEAAENDFNAATRQVEALQKAEERTKMFAEQQVAAGASDGVASTAPAADKRTAAQVFDKLLRAMHMGQGAMMDAANEYRSFMASEKRGTDTQVVGTPSLGGYLVPQYWWENIIESMKFYGPMLDPGVVNVIRTADGAKWNIPTSDQTAVKGALITETTGDIVSDITFGTKALEAYLYTSRLILASYEMLQDSAYDLQGFIARAIAERIGRIANEALTTGDGSNKPNGVASASALGKAAAATNAITRDEILDLIHSVDIAYRPNARLMMNDATILAIKKLTIGSADDRPLWQPSIRDGEPGTIEGYSYLINNDMATLASGVNSRVMLFGDFSKYAVRVVNNLEIKVLQELYAASRSVGYFGFLRLDGELLDGAAVKHLRLAAS